MLGVVADKLDALGVVTHRVQDATQRRLGQGVEQRHRHKGVKSDEVIHLTLRAKADAHESLAHHAVGRHASLATEKFGEHQRHGEHQLGHAQGDHGERGARFFGGDIAQQNGETHASQAAHQGKYHHWQVQRALANGVERMDGKVTAHAAVDRMAKTQHAALPQQQVVGQASNDGNAHLRQHGLRQIAGEYPRGDQQHQRKA